MYRSVTQPQAPDLPEEKVEPYSGVHILIPINGTSWAWKQIDDLFCLYPSLLYFLPSRRPLHPSTFSTKAVIDKHNNIATKLDSPLTSRSTLDPTRCYYQYEVN
jgi:hypothetical protein